MPNYSPLAELANHIVAKENDLFARNIANRLWFVLMGRGIVHPLDMHHGKNPPSHPKLLSLLAKQFVAHGYDLKWMLRQIARTQAYQRSSRFIQNKNNSIPPAKLFLVAMERRMNYESLLRATLQATGHEKLLAVKDPAKDRPYPDLATFNDIHDRFENAYANQRTEPEVKVDFSLKASLFLRNDKKIWAMVQPADGNLVDRLAKLKDDNAVIEELFLNILTRMPEASERKDWATVLKRNKDKRAGAISNIAWAMLASAEFQMNH